MGILKVYLELESIAKEFSEIVVDTRMIKLPSGEPLKLRVYIVDGISPGLLPLAQQSPKQEGILILRGASK